MELLNSIGRTFLHEPIMWLILLVSAFGLSIAVERLRFLRAAGNIRKQEFLQKLNGYIVQGNMERAVALCSQNEGPMANIIKAGLLNLVNNRDVDEIQTAMDAVAMKELPRIERRTSLLAMLANISTLLGLLGTVGGLIGGFQVMTSASAAEKSIVMSASLATSMNCTAFALMVAIPLLACHGYLQNRAMEIIDSIQEVSVSTLNFLIINKDKFKG